MKNKFVSIVLAVLMVASLTTACGSKSEKASSAPAAETKVETKTEEKKEEEPEIKVEEPETESDTAGLEEETEGEEASVDEGQSGDFTLLDVSTDMIQAGVYATSEDGTELVFSMFTEPSGTPMASLFVFPADGEGDVICGEYVAESETDEDGITWSLMTVTDAYTGDDFEIGFGESEEGEVYIFGADGSYYQGEYLSEDETINYMGVAAALME